MVHWLASWTSAAMTQVRFLHWRHIKHENWEIKLSAFPRFDPGLGTSKKLQSILHTIFETLANQWPALNKLDHCGLLCIFPLAAPSIEPSYIDTRTIN